jgi:hypothetical protein
MPRIKDLALLGPMGVASSCCTTAGGHIRALTARHPIKPTSRRCPSAWQPNPGRRSTYRRGKAVQTTGATACSVAARRGCPKLGKNMTETLNALN